MTERWPTPEVRLQPTRFSIQRKAQEGRTMLAWQSWFIWMTPVLATIAVMLEAGYEAGSIHTATASLVVSILTAIAAFVVAFKERNDQKDKEANKEAEKLKAPQTQQQPQKPAQR